MSFTRPLCAAALLLLVLVTACGKVKSDQSADPGGGFDAGAADGGFDAGAADGGAADGGAADGGASGDSDQPDSRLVLWRLESEGAPPFSLGFYDTQQKLHCSFAPDALGQLRCLPFVLPGISPELAFADASCTSRLYSADFTHVLPSGAPFTLPLPQQGCEPVRNTVGTLRLVAGDAPRYGRDAQGSCVLIEQGGEETSYHATIDQLVPPETWASGSETDGPLLSGRLRIRQLQDATGLSIPDHFVDLRWAKPCTLRASLDKDISCWPATVETNDSLFTDAMCASDSLVLADGCVAPAFIESGRDLLSFSERWDGPVFGGVKGCEEVNGPPTNPGSAYFKLGAPLGADALFPVEWQLAGTGRIQVSGLKGDADAFVAISDAMRGAQRPAFRDTLVDQDCTPVWTPEGEVRCLPATVPIGGYTFNTFADSACKDPAYFCFQGTSCAGLDFVPNTVDVDGQLHADSLHQTIDLKHNTFQLTDGSCVPGPNLDVTFFGTGPEAAWAKYPRLVERNGVVSRAAR